MTKNLGTFKGSAILAKTSKMPGYSISTPATDCITGGKLQKLKGSVCSDCYALKGSYTFSNVKPALKKRQEFMKSPKWVELMVETLNRTKSPYFRWFDSGDVQSVEHAKQIPPIILEGAKKAMNDMTARIDILQRISFGNLVQEPSAKVVIVFFAVY